MGPGPYGGTLYEARLFMGGPIMGPGPLWGTLYGPGPFMGEPFMGPDPFGGNPKPCPVIQACSRNQTQVPYVGGMARWPLLHHAQE